MTHVAILGFGMEGQDATKYFLAQGAKITVFDKKPREEIARGGWEKENIKWVCGEDYLKNGLQGFDLIVRSPGVYRYIPQIVEAEKNGAKITSSTILFFENCKTPIIGVTGTKGKGTTASLIAHGLKACGKRVLLLGNIGEPMLLSLEEAKNCDYVLLELSSFQTIDLTKSPHITVVTNITSDHMDWHKDQEEYEQAKRQLWKNQHDDDYLVLNSDDQISMSLAKNATGKVFTYNGENEKASELNIPGKHNVYNVNAALLTIKLLGEDTQKAWEGIESFKGLEHRLENIGEIDGVTYINDSYATNPEPTIAAIHSFEQPKVLILGGSKKGADFTKMAKEIVRSNVRGVVLIGDEAEAIEEALNNTQFKGDMKKGFTKMPEMVSAAKSMAKAGDVVILSPACASFGLFENYKDRGKKFKEAVRGRVLK
ncbi:MAG: UDP-N-acetylmuramoyl-L-alanine--D-glutamate ligase [bacterium]|nr:UDP-N-acetylmuramoyl-L-alanine--D-glutamate ligase [bacterium]